MARQHGNRGAGRTRFPSVNTLSAFLFTPTLPNPCPHACRIDYEAVDATRLQEAREPKSVVARLVAEYDRRLLATHLRPAITCRDELCHQSFAVSAFEWIDAC